MVAFVADETLTVVSVFKHGDVDALIATVLLHSSGKNLDWVIAAISNIMGATISWGSDSATHVATTGKSTADECSFFNVKHLSNLRKWYLIKDWSLQQSVDAVEPAH